jgi:hypothetical protein
MSNRTQRRAEQRRAAKLARKAATPAANITIEHEQNAPEPSHASAAQIAANRENSTHSTGPRSEIGKAAVSQNRRTHGLLSSVFTVLACENQAEYDLLLKTLIAEHKPENTTECLLVTSMARSASNR